MKLGPFKVLAIILSLICKTAIASVDSVGAFSEGHEVFVLGDAHTQLVSDEGNIPQEFVELEKRDMRIVETFVRQLKDCGKKLDFYIEDSDYQRTRSAEIHGDRGKEDGLLHWIGHFGNLNRNYGQISFQDTDHRGNAIRALGQARLQLNDLASTYREIFGKRATLTKSLDYDLHQLDIDLDKNPLDKEYVFKDGGELDHLYEWMIAQTPDRRALTLDDLYQEFDLQLEQLKTQVAMYEVGSPTRKVVKSALNALKKEIDVIKSKFKLTSSKTSVIKALYDVVKKHKKLGDLDRVNFFRSINEITFQTMDVEVLLNTLKSRSEGKSGLGHASRLQAYLKDLGYQTVFNEGKEWKSSELTMQAQVTFTEEELTGHLNKIINALSLNPIVHVEL